MGGKARRGERFWVTREPGSMLAHVWFQQAKPRWDGRWRGKASFNVIDDATFYVSDLLNMGIKEIPCDRPILVELKARTTPEGGK